MATGPAAPASASPAAAGLAIENDCEIDASTTTRQQRKAESGEGGKAKVQHEAVALVRPRVLRGWDICRVRCCEGLLANLLARPSTRGRTFSLSQLERRWRNYA